MFQLLTKTHLFFTAGSYVALTVLGRPPGLPQIPLSEVDLGLGSPGGYGDTFVTSPNSYNAAERTSSPLVSWVRCPYLLANCFLIWFFVFQLVVSSLPYIFPPNKLCNQNVLFAPPCHLSTQPYIGRKQCSTQPKNGQQEDGVQRATGHTGKNLNIRLKTAGLKWAHMLLSVSQSVPVSKVLSYRAVLLLYDLGW